MQAITVFFRRGLTAFGGDKLNLYRYHYVVCSVNMYLYLANHDSFVSA